MKISLPVLAGAIFSLAAWAATSTAYHVTKTIPLKGDTGWDLLSVDSEGKRLFVTRGTHVQVFNLESGSEVGQIPGDGVHGVALAPELGRGFVTNGRSNSVTVFDLKTLKVVAQVPTGKKPDAILYQPVSKQVLAFNAESQSVTLIDGAKATVMATLELGGKPELAVADSSGKVFVNLEDHSAIAVIDPVKPAKLAQWPLAPCQEPTGLALDGEHHRLFAACHNEQLVVVNAENGKVITHVPIGKSVDGAAFDPATQQVFSSNGEGTLTVIHEDTPDTFSVVGNVPTQKSARTLALDPASHRIYTVAAKFQERAAAAQKRPAMIPGSAVLLILDQ